jgi:hypothetical protein
MAHAAHQIDTQSGVTFAVTLNGNELIFLPHKGQKVGKAGSRGASQPEAVNCRM